MTFGERGLVISGHREIADGDVAIVRNSMAEFIGYGEFDYIMFGGARGADTIALASVLDLRPIWLRRPYLVVVVPDTLAAQPRETWSTSERADRIIELGHPINGEDNFWALRHRNEFMIDWVFPEGRLLAFWNGQKSGTANAVAYARSTELDVSVRSISGRPKAAIWRPVRA